MALLALTGAAWARTDMPSRIGAGNLHANSGNEARLEVLRGLGAGVCRIPLDGNGYWMNGRAVANIADTGVLAARAHGIEPIILFEYYTRWHGSLGDYDKWFAIGKAFAERYRPNSEWLASQGIRDWGVRHYTAINEPMWKSNNPTPIDPQTYADALRGLADGVHSVDETLRVSPGGYQEIPLFQKTNRYLPAVADLYRAGKLWAIDIHRYWDVQYVPIERYECSLQAQFDMVKEWLDLPDSVRFHTTETNFKKRLVTEDEAAAGFLTGLWDALTVSDSKNRVVSDFVMPWNVFHLTERDESYGLCTQLTPWAPTARGKTLAMLCRLADGLSITHTDPRGTGVTVLDGNGRRLVVWQNRKGWSSLHGTTFELRGIPADAAAVVVHGWDGERRTLPVERGAMSIRVLDLPTNETLLFEIRR